MRLVDADGAIGKLDPAVGLAQSRERLLEFKQVVDTVL